MKRLLWGEEGYSLAWWAAFLGVLLLPLAGLAIEMPRYMAFKENVQRMADAAAEAGAHLGFDAPHYYATGEVRLQHAWAAQAAYSTIAQNSGWVAGKGSITGVSVSINGRFIVVDVYARMRLFIPGVPSFPIHARAVSQARVNLR